MLKIKNVVAFGLAAAMTFGSVFTVSAASVSPASVIEEVGVANSGAAVGSGTAIGNQKTASGSGSNIYVQKKIFKVMMPTQERMNDIFHYHADPLGLFKEAEDKTINVDGDDNGILFRNYNDEGEFQHLSKQSDKLTIINLSSSGVELEWQAYAESAAATAFTGMLATAYDAEAKTFSAGSVANTGTVWFGLKPQYGESVALDYDGSTAGVETHTSIILSSVDNYRTVQSASSIADMTFTYERKPDTDTNSFAKFSFSIEGALDRTLSEDNWFDDADNIGTLKNGKAKEMPTLKLIFTPKYIDAKQGRAEYNDDGIQNLRLGRSDDDTIVKYGEIAKVTEVRVNGVAVTPTWKDIDNGTEGDKNARIEFAGIYSTLTGDSTTTDGGVMRENLDKKGISVATISWKYNGQLYFANLRNIPDADAK